MARMAGESPVVTPVPDAVVPHEHLERQLERVDRLYDICVRDYFSTFGTYATATSIFLFGMSFVVEDVKSSVLVLALGLIGIFLCLQWHISTTTMRDQYSHFYARMLMLEEQLGQQVMTRWNDAAMRARGRPSSPTTQSADDASYLTWSFRNLGRGWSQRAAALPVIYSAFFVALMISRAGQSSGWFSRDCRGSRPDLACRRQLPHRRRAEARTSWSPK